MRDAAQSGPPGRADRLHRVAPRLLRFQPRSHSAIVDGSQTRVSGPRLVNLLVWFDNEWGFANRMLDVAGHWLRIAKPT